MSCFPRRVKVFQGNGLIISKSCIISQQFSKHALWMLNNTRRAWPASLFCWCHAFHTRILHHCKEGLLSRGRSMAVLRSTVTFLAQKSVLLLQSRIEKGLYFKLQIVFKVTSRKHQEILPRCFKFGIFSVLNSVAVLFREVGCVHAVSLLFLLASRARNIYDPRMLIPTFCDH